MARKIYSTLTFYHVLPTGGTTAVDAVTSFVPGFRGKIVKWSFLTTVAITGAGATRTPNLEIGSTDVTGSNSVALALADGSDVGEVKALGTPTALNEFSETDGISIEWAASGTTYDGGAGIFVLTLEQSARGI